MSHGQEMSPWRKQLCITTIANFFFLLFNFGKFLIFPFENCWKMVTKSMQRWEAFNFSLNYLFSFWGKGNSKWYSRCLKITEKVLFNIASEASYVYKWTKVHQKCQKRFILKVFEKLNLAVKQCYQTGHF